MKISKLDDKLYKKYKNLFIYNYNKFMLINDIILYNLQNEYKKICNFKFKYSQYDQIYNNIVLKTKYNLFTFNLEHLIPIYKNSNDYLIIANATSIILNNYYNNKNIDCIIYYNSHLNTSSITYYIDKLNKYKKENKINSDLNIYLEKFIFTIFK